MDAYRLSCEVNDDVVPFDGLTFLGCRSFTEQREEERRLEYGKMLLTKSSPPYSIGKVEQVIGLVGEILMAPARLLKYDMRLPIPGSTGGNTRDNCLICI